jgi:hypothetical protein
MDEGSYAAKRTCAPSSYASAMLAQPHKQSCEPEEPEGISRGRHREDAKRRLHKEFVKNLDALLPEAFRSIPVKNCAGRRSLGSEGRSLHDVLVDTIQCLKAMKPRDVAGDADEHTPAHSVALGSEVSGAAMRDALMSSHSLAVMELEMPSWTITSLNPGAKELLGDTPWASSEGQCLLNALVHWEDVSTLQNMWLEAQSAGKNFDPTSAGPPQADDSSSRKVRFSRYHLHDPVQVVSAEVKERHGEEVSSDAYIPQERAASSSSSSSPSSSFASSVIFFCHQVFVS